MVVDIFVELAAEWGQAVEDAVQSGLAKCAETVKNIQGAWVKGIKVVTDDTGRITEWRVDLKVTFLVR